MVANRNIGIFINILWAVTIRDIKGKYRRSALGLSWAFLQPLALMITFSVFRLFVSIPSDGLPFVIFTYSALVPWTFFTNGVNNCGQCLYENGEILKKIAAPKLVFPFSAIIRALFDFCMAFAVLVLMMLWFKAPVSIYTLWALGLMAPLVGLAFGIGLIMASLGVFKRDFIFAAPFFFQIWMFLSPVIYPLSSVPDHLRPLYILNPMVGIIEGFRNAIVKGVAPPMDALMASIAVAGLMVLVGCVVFNELSKHFVDVL
jgi:lipopolysaccharide transport system permease protein